MATHYEVLAYLRPNGGYVQVGEDFEGITFEANCEPFTKAEYEAAFDELDSLKNSAIEAKANAEAKLAALGLTSEDLRALGLA